MTEQSKTDPEETDPDEDLDELERVSRSQRKREAEEITHLGQSISELPESDLQKIPLEERVRDAVYELRKIRSFGARKRQLHYLGKVLRQSDLEPIRAALKAIQLSATAETRLLHAAEHWRDRLLTQGDSALTEFVQQYPATDRQQLRQVARNHAREAGSRKQQTASSATRASRELFKILRTILADADTG